jgi:hypothetical protein
VLLSLGGLLLHVRSHPPTANPANYAPFVLGIANVVLVPFLLLGKRTWLPGYLINGFSVIIGIVLMGAFSLYRLPQPLTVTTIFLKTTLPYIILSLPKLFIAQRILYFYHATGMGRFFTTWWWTRHVGYVVILFTIGQLLGR